MKIGLLHLTDLHIGLNPSFWDSKLVSKIVTATLGYYQDCKEIIIICTGDIVNTGSKDEFSIASKFFLSLKSLLNQFHQNVNDIIVTVPGNHDCNLSHEPQVRKILIDKLNYDTIGLDNTVIDNLITPQNEYFDFFKNLNGITVDNPLLYNVTINIEGLKVGFNCINTAWCSKISESPGTLFYPIKLQSKNFDKESDISITIFHHHPAWLTPNSDNCNNRVEFEDTINSMSDLILMGHEHEFNITLGSDKKGNVVSWLIEGEALYAQSSKRVTSGFQLFIIDSESRKVEQNTFLFNHKDEIYKPYGEKVEFQLKEKYTRNHDFNLNENFISELRKIEIPLIQESKTVNIENLFVYPDIETSDNIDKDIDSKYYDSSFILNTKNYNIFFLEGENQTGKTSLLKKLFLDTLKDEVYPLFINGTEINIKKIQSSLEKCYKKEYSNSDFEVYKQYDKEKKIILIDNLPEHLSYAELKNLITELNIYFNKIIITTAPRYDVLSLIETLNKNFFFGRILPLGYEKRANLIEAYYKLSNPDWQIKDTQKYIEDTNHLIEEVQNIIGNKIIPPYPIFIISILQSINMMKPANIEQTSYGYCYQTLIHYALAVKAKIENTDMSSYINYLCELAYYIYENYQEDNAWISKDKFEEFHSAYKEKYICKDFSIICNNLIKSNLIIKNNDEEYRFGYPYIYYFLVAQKIASILNTSVGKEELKHLCNNLHRDQCANILIFITHHSKDKNLLDEAIFSLMVPFEGIEPITLEKDKPYYNIISSVKENTNDRIIDDSDPLAERKKLLRKKDQLEKLETYNNVLNEESRLPTELVILQQAIRAIEIVGQIIKNNKGSLPKEQLEKIISELYLTAFRIIGFFGSVISESKQEIIDAIKKENSEYEPTYKMNLKVDSVLQDLGLRFCLGIFSKVIHSVGVTDLRELYNNVASLINTPASEILTFSINTCYGRMSISELTKIQKKTDNNQAILRILKARVRAYLYNNVVDYSKKQKIASIMNWKLEHKLPVKYK